MRPALPTALAACLLLAACGDAATDTSATPAAATATDPTPVTVARPAPLAERRTARGIGRLEAADEASLGFASAGVIAAIEVDLGDTVRAGQVLARLDAAALDAQLARAREQAGKARRDLDRARELVDRQLVAREAVDNAATALEVAEADVRAAGFQRRYGEIVAAADGRVLARLAEPGEVVAAGQPVLRLSGEGQAWRLRVELADRDALAIAPGAAAEVSLDALPGRVFAARVERIGAAASAASGAIAVELRLDPAAGAPLRSGLVARARIDAAAGGGLGLPVEALLAGDDGRGEVIVLEDGRARRRAVTIGALRDGQVEVLDGLAGDEAVVVGGGAWLDEGEAALAVPAPGAADADAASAADAR